MVTGLRTLVSKVLGSLREARTYSSDNPGATIGSGDSDFYTTESIWQAINHATSLGQHSDNQAQLRLYNFLVGDSILLLSWATVYAGPTNSTSRFVLLLLSTLSALLSLMWMLLGVRQQAYIKTHWTRTAELEEKLPKDLRISSFVVGPEGVQHRGRVVLPSGRSFSFGRGGQLVTTGRLLIWAPLLFAVASLCLVGLSVDWSAIVTTFFPSPT